MPPSCTPKQMPTLGKAHHRQGDRYFKQGRPTILPPEEIWQDYSAMPINQT